MSDQRVIDVGGRPRLAGEQVLRPVAVKLLPEQRATIERLAVEQHTTMSEVIRSLIGEALERLARLEQAGDEGEP